MFCSQYTVMLYNRAMAGLLHRNKQESSKEGTAADVCSLLQPRPTNVHQPVL